MCSSTLKTKAIQSILEIIVNYLYLLMIDNQ